MKYTALFMALALALAGCASTPAGESPAAAATSSPIPDVLEPGVWVIKKDGRITVTWIFDEPEAKSVGLVGDFQNWDQTKAKKLAKNKDGYWQITMPAKLDSVFTYKYYVDGKWYQDPNPPESDNDGMGGRNGKVVVADLILEAK